MCDSPSADYGDKLEGFASFASRELERLVATLPIGAGSRVLDAGCGTGRLLPIFQQHVGADGRVVGMDLAGPHLNVARRWEGCLVQADFEHPPFRPQSFDTIWMLNALNHAESQSRVIAGLVDLLSPGGCLAVAQSAMLPDMMFAWDLRLERLVHEACRRAYHDGYGLESSDSTDVRGLVGLLRDGGLAAVSATTVVIERVSPLSAGDERYLREIVFEGYWGEKLRPYLSRRDWATLAALCDPRSSEYALTRADFHHAQTLTLVVGRRSPP